MTSFLAALALVFVAEIGDKSQLIVLAFASRYEPRVVLPAILMATAAIHLLSVTLGSAISHVLPLFWIQLLAGTAFIAFGLWTLLPPSAESVPGAIVSRWGPMATVAATFFLSELGDKTMLTAIAVSSQHRSFFPVWLGSTLGMFLADSIALVAGVVMGKHLADRAMRFGSATVFLATGIVTLYLALR